MMGTKKKGEELSPGRQNKGEFTLKSTWEKLDYPLDELLTVISKLQFE